MVLYDLATKLGIGEKYLKECVNDALEGNDSNLDLLAERMGAGAASAIGNQIRNAASNKKT